MNTTKIGFGLKHLRAQTPAFIHWISVSGAGLVTLLAGLQALYPTLISDAVVAETAKVLAAVRLVGQFFGVKDETKEPEQTDIPRGTQI